ncbi:ArdC family protein [Magnetofaba australis]|uniref:Antirestriction protein n=1 Tax=Magnetofaba australis IT-1 TaxID=1434232 RepID=A0A1Y2KAG3_9PROT|nr:zincin-like metallopeptidase domain-containing protein [Magnetofaba australis]OSM07708.1 hypothetical protein MAIT1_04521 [Magnetofaba australis IT-1]
MNPFEEITTRIITLMEQGHIPWRKPWASAGTSEHALNFSTKKHYRGINAFLLPVMGSLQGYVSPYWTTYKQAQEKGGQVRKGEKGFPVVFFSFQEKRLDQLDDNGNPLLDRYALLKRYTVFNIDQCDGLDAPRPAPVATPAAFSPIDAAERIVTDWRDAPPIRYGGARACYTPGSDRIQMPPRDAFHGAEEFYSTLFHEMGHATGHASRLDRDMKPLLVSRHSYSKEELIAEFTACFLCNRAGILPHTEENSAAYLRSWMTVLKNDPRMAVYAAAQAQKAADWILHTRAADAETRRAA